ncbi:MAG TPA: hypothetical protein VKR30_10505 [Candidatus Limnocylindrales bacterium]|nr:hypothetical protein [Candidatus Limnocylindrales bacterium]
MEEGTLRSPRVVRDSVHNYISFSELDQSVIDSRAFQRLRYISQNPLAHQTYPTNRTSRFVHSLGCMHVGGEFLLNALRYSDGPLIERFLRDFRVEVERVGKALDLDRTEGLFLEMGDPFYVDAAVVSERFTRSTEAWARPFNIATMIEATRLACVIHDVGHLPFSHTMEAVFEGLFSAGPTSRTDRREMFAESLEQVAKVAPSRHDQLHEQLGLRVADRLLASARHEQPGADFAAVCFSLASDIVRARETGSSSSLTALHTIVSGEIDADRADYVQRDGQASSFEFGRFDLERLSRGMRLCRGPNNEYLFRPTTVALSAAESFFVERFRVYRWLVFHHNVVRAQLCLERAAFEILSLYLDGGLDADDQAAFVSLVASFDVDGLWEPFREKATAEVVKRWDRANENAFLAMCGLLLDSTLLSPVHRGVPVVHPELGRRLAILRVYLQVVCDREKPTVLPLWKRLADYRSFAGAFLAAARVEAERTGFFEIEANAALRPADDSKLERVDPVLFLNRLLRHQLTPQASAPEDDAPAEGGSLAVMRRFEAAVEASWGNCPGKVLFTYFYRFRAGPPKDYGLVGREPDELVPLVTLSAEVAGLEEAWGVDMQSFAYLIPLSGEEATLKAIQIPSHRVPTLRDEFAAAAARVLLNPEFRLAVLSAPTPPSVGGAIEGIAK